MNGLNYSPWNNKSNIGYSSYKKNFYGVVPNNSQENTYASVQGHFDISRLPQTDVLEGISKNVGPSLMGEVSLSKTLPKVYRSIGAIKNLDGHCLGTGTLIADNLMLVARHSLEGTDVRNLSVTFEHCKKPGGGYTPSSSYQVDSVMESDPQLDYAIVRLKGIPGLKHGTVTINNNSMPMTELALLHHPLGKPLKVSVHTFVHTFYQSSYLNTFHDSDYNSSGGAYIDPSGQLVAMHLGSEINKHDMNLQRYAIPISEITKSVPIGILSQLADGKLDRNNAYKSQRPIYYLEPIERHFIDSEGDYFPYGAKNKTPHIHAYGGGFHVKLAGGKRLNIVQKGTVYKDNLIEALEASKENNALRKVIIEELESYFSLKELGLDETDQVDDSPYDYASMNDMWNAKGKQLNKKYPHDRFLYKLTS
ncbi:hypothetical protein DID80_08430 [Candidatus Marinamargulisbacteria bacterium SCGC AAA071-K20]|nr:hypothetical protein DID80_08430 [Candidatus Marinamargulisbacteria bacterium SCGC AAA071-K20]